MEKSYEEHPRSKRWIYKDYNFTLALLLTTHLVEAKGINADSTSPMELHASPVELHLDEVDKAWSTQVQDFDYVIISTGHWFSRPLMYREKNEVVGCSMCGKENITDLTRYLVVSNIHRISLISNYLWSDSKIKNKKSRSNYFLKFLCTLTFPPISLGQNFGFRLIFFQVLWIQKGTSIHL